MVVGTDFNLYAAFISKDKGYGVFSSSYIPIGSVIETCYCIKISGYEWEDYTFGDPRVIPLGYGAMYNHSFHANAIWELDAKNNIMAFVSQKDIHPGDEITHNYGENYWKDRSNKKLI
jgi:SET domain-containing protein